MGPRNKWGFGEGLLKDKFAFFEAYKNPIPKRRKLLAKCPFFEGKRALFKTPFKLDRASFSAAEFAFFIEIQFRPEVQEGVAPCECSSTLIAVELGGSPSFGWNLRRLGSVSACLG